MPTKKTKSITQDELLKFNNFINKRKEILTSLGAAELQLVNIQQKKDQLFSSMQNLDVLEKDFNQELIRK